MVLLEQLVLLVTLDSLVLQDQLDSSVLKDREVLMDLLVLVGELAPRDQWVILGCKGLEDK